MSGCCFCFLKPASPPANGEAKPRKSKVTGERGEKKRVHRGSILCVMKNLSTKENLEDLSTQLSMTKSETTRSLVKEALMMNPHVGPLLSDLPPAALYSIVDLAIRVDAKPGDVLLSQGDHDSDKFFIVESGEIDFIVDGKKVGQVGAGGTFGELSLLNLTERAATCTAATDSTVWALSRGSLAVAYGQPLREKLQKYAAALDKVKMFASKSKKLRAALADALTEHVYDKGEYIFKAGDDADAAYLLWDGEAALEYPFGENDIGRTLSGTSSGSGQVKPRVEGLLGDPSSEVASPFGFTSLINSAPRSNSVVVKSSKATVLVLDKKVFLKVVKSADAKEEAARHTPKEHWGNLRGKVLGAIKQRYQAYTELLGTVELFRRKSYAVRSTLAHKLTSEEYTKGAVIWEQGSVAEYACILYTGEVATYRDGEEVCRLEGDVVQNQHPCFGTRSLLHGARHAAGMRVVSDSAKVLTISGKDFIACMQENDEEEDCGNKGENTDVEYKLEDLEEVGILGTGSFGKVTLVKHPSTEQSFALKKISKGWVVQNKAQAQTVNEKKVLHLVNSPFLVRAAATFRDDEHVYFLMELALGGELFEVCERNGFFGSQRHTRFFTACTVRALEHLHARHIIYRDLKPENLFVDSTGYVKMGDFGLAKLVTGRTGTMCGTPEYFAPEIVDHTPYNAAVDWWALGCVIYELNVGKTPFFTKSGNFDVLFKKIKLGIDIVDFPDEPGHEAWSDLVRSLCQAEPSERLAMKRGGVKNIEFHNWFTQTHAELEVFNWKQFTQRIATPPFVPDVDLNEAVKAHADEPEPPPFVPFTPRGGWLRSSREPEWDEGFESRWGPVLNAPIRQSCKSLRDSAQSCASLNYDPKAALNHGKSLKSLEAEFRSNNERLWPQNK